MKNKKLILGLSIIVITLGVLYLPKLVYAVEYIKFTPNVVIPNTDFTQTVNIDSDSLGNYIEALYSYGATLAGVVAMFMLVLAGWQWLMAGGSADKISAAKSTINGALIGLMLLFGGYLLLSQITDRLVNFRSLSINAPDLFAGEADFCAQGGFKASCGVVSGTATTSPVTSGVMYCIGLDCLGVDAGKSCIDNNTKDDCPGGKAANADDPSCSCQTTNCAEIFPEGQNHWCSDYKIRSMCENNTCFGQGIDKLCGISYNDPDYKCIPITDVRCENDSDCVVPGNQYCCGDHTLDKDTCDYRKNGDPNSMETGTIGVECQPY